MSLKIWDLEEGRTYYAGYAKYRIYNGEFQYRTSISKVFQKSEMNYGDLIELDFTPVGVDWSKVPVDTKVITNIRSRLYNHPAHFKGVTEDGLVEVYPLGSTSFTYRAETHGRFPDPYELEDITLYEEDERWMV